MSVMRIIVLHQCTKFEVRRPSSSSEDMTDFRSRVNWPNDLDPSTSKRTQHLFHDTLSIL